MPRRGTERTKTLALELRHRFAHRRAADAEVLSELALVEPDVVPVAIDVHRHDGVLQRRIGLVLEARACFRADRPRRCAPRRVCRRFRLGGALRLVKAARGRSHLWYTIFPQLRPDAKPPLFQLAATFQYAQCTFRAGLGRLGPQPGQPFLDQRPEQRDQAERHDRAHQPVREEDAEAALRASNDWRNASSALSPSTIASTIGASG